MSSTTFQYPPIYNFPPFFTKQVHEETWLKQCQQWSNLILEYCQHEKIFELEISTMVLPIFTNTSINRKLDEETLNDILGEMVLTGQAEYLSNNNNAVVDKKRCLIYWRKPSEWADLVYSHIQGTGQTNSIVTVYELFGDESNGFFIPESMWRRTLKVLEREGKAKLFDSEEVANSMELGIKFF